MDYTTFTASAATAIFLLFAGPAAAQPAEADTGVDLDGQLAIMAKVVESSLDESGLGSWKGLPAQIPGLGPAVTSQYVPTVGAIFTIPVTFLIVEPPAEAPGREGPKPDTDLWEKFLNESGGDRDPVEVPRNLDQLEDRLRTEELVLSNPESPRLGYEAPDSGDEVAKQFLNWLPEVAGQPLTYDGDRVTRLRETLVSTVAKYGHRLSGVPPEERVIVIVEAPKAVDLASNSTDSLSQSLAWLTERHRRKDRLFLGFDKARLTEAATPEALAEPVRVIAY